MGFHKGLFEKAVAFGGKALAQYSAGGGRRGMAPGLSSSYVDRGPTGSPYDAAPRRRSRQGLSGRDIKGAQKVMRLVQAFGYKPKIKARKKGRR